MAQRKEERVLRYFTWWFCGFVNKSLRPFWVLVYETGTAEEPTPWDLFEE